MQPIRLGLDPRSKLLLGLVAIIVVAAAPGWPWLAAMCALCLAGIWAGALFQGIGRWLGAVLPTTLFFGLVTALSADLAAGVLASLKLLAMAMVGYLFFASTAPEDLANALLKAGMPYRAAFVLCAGLQFVPVLGRKARDILQAQQTRGIPMQIGWRALRHYPAFLTPLLVQAFQLAEELAEAMECRGFGRPHRTALRNLRLAPRDWLAIGGAILSATGLLLKWYI